MLLSEEVAKDVVEVVERFEALEGFLKEGFFFVHRLVLPHLDCFFLAPLSVHLSPSLSITSPPSASSPPLFCRLRCTRLRRNFSWDGLRKTDVRLFSPRTGICISFALVGPPILRRTSVRLPYESDAHLAVSTPSRARARDPHAWIRMRPLDAGQHATFMDTMARSNASKSNGSNGGDDCIDCIDCDGCDGCDGYDGCGDCDYNTCDYNTETTWSEPHRKRRCNQPLSHLYVTAPALWTPDSTISIPPGFAVLNQPTTARSADSCILSLQRHIYCRCAAPTPKSHLLSLTAGPSPEIRSSHFALGFVPSGSTLSSVFCLVSARLLLGPPLTLAGICSNTPFNKHCEVPDVMHWTPSAKRESWQALAQPT